MRSLAFLAAVAALALVLISARQNRKAIARARAEAAWLAGERDSLLAVIAERERQRAALAIERDRVSATASALRDSVAFQERRRAAFQLTVREIRTVGVLQERLRTTFPELGTSGWGLTRVPLDRGDTVGIEYLMVPAWFAETFVIDHANAESWRAQKDQLLAVDSLRLVVTALGDSIGRLVAANAHAYETGYQVAYAAYQGLSERHIAELSRPRVRLGRALGLIGAVGVGLVAGRAIP
ncbi:MAG TPA: hypothetical protein VNL98_12345 [Gemmatimonadales bacterium]|nr:hypothetical protein [Gemmatimonadales bacterium]